jgi:short-subunit dehydrogenase
VVTGAASGIGLALAEAIDRQGGRLVLVDHDQATLLSIAERLPGVERLEAIDVANRQAMFTLADAVARETGGAALVINNAGVGLAETVEHMTHEDFAWVMNINFWGMVHGSQAFLPQLQRQERAALVNISSAFGLIAVPTQSAYNASKFAIRGFTEALAAELAGGPVSVHSVHPGGVRTNIARNARFHRGPSGDRDRERFVNLFDRLTLTTPEQAADIILEGVKRRNPRILVGPDAVALDVLQRLFPRRYGQALRLLTRLA